MKSLIKNDAKKTASSLRRAVYMWVLPLDIVTFIRFQ